MPLPANFNEWEHLQGQIMRLHNRAVRDWFNDAPDDDISTSRASMKQACLIKDNDTTALMHMRMWLFEVTCGRLASLQTPVYGIPVQELQQDTKFKPQVKLIFYEDLQDVEDGYRAIEGEITFRLMNETSESITPANAMSLANKIRSEFATGSLYRWHRGRYKATYLDKENGYDFRLQVFNQSEAEELIRKVLSIKDKVPDWSLFTYHETKDASSAYPTIPGTQRVYGQTVKKPRKRPVGWVRFRKAQLLIWGRNKAVTLVDSTGYSRDALLKI